MPCAAAGVHSRTGRRRLLPDRHASHRITGGAPSLGRTVYQRDKRRGNGFFCGVQFILRVLPELRNLGWRHRQADCQNYEISELRRGIEISVERLAEIYRELIARGAHNIDLVTPTHFTHAVFQSLREPLPVPVVYNCGGYESVHTVAFLRKKIQCWLPDLKYSDAVAAERYSSASDYFEKAVSAIEQMFRQTGPYEIGADGILKKGVLIRHLILPGQMKNTKGVLEYVAETFRKGDVLFSLMRQYTPHGRAEEFPEINRRITDEEYEEAEAYMEALNIEDGYVQQKESSDQSFIPVFDGTGVERAAESNTKK